MPAKEIFLDPLLDRMISEGFTELHLAAGFMPSIVDRGTAKDLNKDVISGRLLADLLIEIIDPKEWDELLTTISRGGEITVRTVLLHGNATLEVTVIAEGSSTFNVTFRNLEQNPS